MSPRLLMQCMSIRSSTINNISSSQRATDQWLSGCPAEASVALVGMGANLPSGKQSPADTLQQALEVMRPLSLQMPLVSPFIATEPEDCPPGSPVFVNAVAMLCCSAATSPVSLLESLLDIEGRLGRARSGLRNEPRVLDLDLLAFADQECDSDFLTLPHPRAHQRRFVLEPLSALWPEYQFPGQSQSVKTLLTSLLAA